uniref:Uncharacterized protein n=1 Tax=Anguilla anguilla TaxID=7936 RepID=A0A0E9X7T8_ANGAN
MATDSSPTITPKNQTLWLSHRSTDALSLSTNNRCIPDIRGAFIVLDLCVYQPTNFMKWLDLKEC